MGLLLFTLTTSRLALHGWLLIEIQLNLFALNGNAFVKLDRIVNPVKKTFLTNPNIFIYTASFFFIKYLWMSLISPTSVAPNKQLFSVGSLTFEQDAPNS